MLAAISLETSPSSASLGVRTSPTNLYLSVFAINFSVTGPSRFLSSVEAVAANTSTEADVSRSHFMTALHEGATLTRVDAKTSRCKDRTCTQCFTGPQGENARQDGCSPDSPRVSATRRSVPFRVLGGKQTNAG